MEMNNNLNVKPTQKQEPLFFIPMIAMGIGALWPLVENIGSLSEEKADIFLILNLVSCIARLIITGSCILFFLNKKEAKLCVYIATAILFINSIVNSLACLIEYGVPSMVTSVIGSLIGLIPYLFLALSVKNDGKKFLIRTIVFMVIPIVISIASFILILISYFSKVYILEITILNTFKGVVLLIIQAIAIISLPIILKNVYDKANPNKPAFVVPAQPVPQYRPVQPAQPYQPAPQYRPVQPAQPYQPAPQYQPVPPVQPVQPNMQNNPNFAYMNRQAPTPAQPEQSPIEKELSALKVLLDQGVLTQEEYDTKQAEILNKHNF